MERKKLKSQTNNSEFALLRITLKIKTKGGGTFTYRSRKTRRIFSIVGQQDFSEGFLKVGYGVGFHNSGIYKSKRGLLFALRAFTDKSLIDYLRG